MHEIRQGLASTMQLNWYERARVKRLFIRGDETAMQLHVPRARMCPQPLRHCISGLQQAGEKFPTTQKLVGTPGLNAAEVK